MAIKCILFDVGGVILNYNNKWYFEYLSKKFGIDASTIENAIRKQLTAFELGKITKAEFETSLAEIVNASPKDMKWFEFFKETASINEDTVELARKLHESGYITAIFSNIDKSRWKHVAGMRWITFMDYRFASCYIGLTKPMKAAYLRVSEKMGLEPSEVFFTDDKPENVAGARESGMHSFLFKNASKLLAELHQFGI
ncbi:MAG: HAD family phosphatase [Candidatus Micrarchaeaceae archaeon]